MHHQALAGGGMALALQGMTTTVALAATAQMTQLKVDDLAVSFFNSLLEVWIPIIAAIALIGVVVAIFTGFLQAGPKIIGFAVGMAVLAIGLPGWNTLMGGQIKTSLVYPVAIIVPYAPSVPLAP